MLSLETIKTEWLGKEKLTTSEIKQLQEYTNECKLNMEKALTTILPIREKDFELRKGELVYQSSKYDRFDRRVLTDLITAAACHGKGHAQIGEWDIVAGFPHKPDEPGVFWNNLFINKGIAEECPFDLI